MEVSPFSFFARAAPRFDALFGQLPRTGYAWAPVARRALREAFARGEMERVRAIASALREERGPGDVALIVNEWTPDTRAALEAALAGDEMTVIVSKC